MQFIRGIHNIKPNDHGCVLTIGNFDGVHLGHARVIEVLVEKAKKLGLPSVVMVFEPQPQELFNPKNAPARLSRLRDKYNQIKKLGVDKLLAVKFNATFASQSAEQFIEQLLVQKLGIKHLIIGDDFRFGKGRTGNFALLQQAGQQLGFSVTDTQTIKVHESRISSTAIREALLADKLQEAEQMLGRPYAISGRVVHGDKQGRELGFPTANVLLKRLVSPVSGVYLVQVKLNQQLYYGVANIGSRPTVNGIRQQLEVHLFNFHQMLYGQLLEVVLLAKLRDEQKFASLNELTTQISCDVQQALTMIEQHNLTSTLNSNG